VKFVAGTPVQWTIDGEYHLGKIAFVKNVLHNVAWDEGRILVQEAYGRPLVFVWSALLKELPIRED